jgi:hypothetical protein
MDIKYDEYGMAYVANRDQLIDAAEEKADLAEITSIMGEMLKTQTAYEK